jgi:hypothetical protein
MDGRKLRHPDVMEDPENGELPILIDEGVVADDGEIDLHAPARVARRSWGWETGGARRVPAHT